MLGSAGLCSPLTLAHSGILRVHTDCVASLQCSISLSTRAMPGHDICWAEYGATLTVSERVEIWLRRATFYRNLPTIF